jgi:tripartite ATP-independent transporter DctP family solute receptor
MDCFAAQKVKGCGNADQAKSTNEKAWTSPIASAEMRSRNNMDQREEYMRRLLQTISFLVAGTFVAMGAAHANPEFKLKFASYAPKGDIIDLATNLFKDEVEKLTKGRVEVTIFGNNSLGSNREALEMAKVGGVDFVVAGSTHVSRYAPVLHTISLPYMWKDRDTMLSLLDSEVGAKITEIVARQGLQVIGWWDTGFRHVSNSKRPILKVEDMKGLKLRTLPSPVHVSFFRAVGAVPTPMDWAEVMPALQQGVIDGQENPPSVMYPYRVFEFQKFYSLTRHVNDPTVVVMSSQTLAKMPKELQDAVMQAAKAATAYERKIADEYNTKIMGDLGKVMTINEVPDSTLAELRKLALTVYEKAYADFGDDGKMIIEEINKRTK